MSLEPPTMAVRCRQVRDPSTSSTSFLPPPTPPSATLATIYLPLSLVESCLSLISFYNSYLHRSFLSTDLQPQTFDLDDDETTLHYWIPDPITPTPTSPSSSSSIASDSRPHFSDATKSAPSPTTSTSLSTTLSSSANLPLALSIALPTALRSSSPSPPPPPNLLFLLPSAITNTPSDCPSHCLSYSTLAPSSFAPTLPQPRPPPPIQLLCTDSPLGPSAFSILDVAESGTPSPLPPPRRLCLGSVPL